MKKLILIAASLASMFFAGSCQRENLEPVVEGTTVTYTVKVPGAEATKASEYSGVVDKLIYEVYRIDENGNPVKDENGNPVKLYQNDETTIVKGEATLNIEVVKDQNVTILFWAQDSDANYITDNLTSVQMPAALTANVDLYEAFYGKDDFVFKDDITRTNTVELTRAVSMLNIGTTAASLNVGGVTDNVTLKESSVKLSLPNTLNIMTGAASEDPVEATYSYSTDDLVTVPSGTFRVGSEDYVYVSKNFVAFADKNKSTADVTLKILTDEGEITHKIPSVPFQRNYKTNIVGDLITATAKYTVSLTNDWATEEHDIVLVDDPTSLQAAINGVQDGKPTEIKLGGDVDLNDLASLLSPFATKASHPSAGIVIPAGKTIVLNLNNCTVSQTLACEDSYSMIDNNGNLTVTGGGSLVFKNNSEGGGSAWGTYTINNKGTLTIDGATVSHLGSTGDVAVNRPTDIAIQNYAGKVTVNAGIISSQYFRSLRDFTAGGEIVINGGTFNGQVWMQGLGNGSSSLTVNGGEFAPISGYDSSSLYITNSTNVVNVSIKGGTFSTKIGAAVADKEGVAGCITGGKFTTDAKDNTNNALFSDDYTLVESENGYWTLAAKPAVAKIGETTYTSLQKAVAAVEDGQTITLVADEKFTENNRYNNGGWWDGLGYSGDKSFTIDLGGHTISQNGALNDYLVWIKNVGSKENTITFKNGTMDAGTSAYCALCTASSHENKLTVNLENITLINENSNGSTVKIRAGSELNVKAGTKITGENSYLGIENWNAVVNIYDGAEIYMNGTKSYNGCLVGVGGNGTINVYGGYGKGVSGGLIAMTSGGTINAKGGEWIANTDGTYANSNKSVLIAQSDKQYNAGAGNAVINVTGGTFKGGYNCYGNAVGDAQINIKGGNFNADPTTYVVAGYEAKEENGFYVVSKKPEATVNGTSYGTLAEAVAAAKEGDTVTVIDDVTLSSELALPAGIIFNGNGKQINGTIYAGAEGNLTFVGHTKVTAFSASYYNRTITIGEGACLEVTGTGRVTLGYGNVFNITGSLENAKTVDKTNVQPSLIIPAGISITGGSDAAMNVTNAYVQIGSTTSKPGVANGKFALSFNNAIVEFTKELGLYEPTGGTNPTFEMTIVNSVFTTGTKLFLTNSSKVNVENSTVALGSYIRNSGFLNLTKGSTLTGATNQFGENGGNNGTINVDNSSLTINATSTGHAFDGQGVGSINLSNNAQASVTYYKAMTITNDGTSTFTGTEVK